jgi:hypothetical protein
MRHMTMSRGESQGRSYIARPDCPKIRDSRLKNKCGTYILLVRFEQEGETAVHQPEHDQQLRAAARAIYDTVYPGEEWTPVPFAEAERCGTVHYRNAVAAALLARAQLGSDAARQMILL